MDYNQICEEIGKMLITISSYKIVLGLLFSWVLAICIGELFGAFTRRIQKNFIRNIEHSEISPFPKDKWRRAVDVGERLLYPNQWLGRFEVTLFYILLFICKPEGIGIWLVFKVAAKWESWANIIKMPNNIKDVDDLDYLAMRNRFSTVVTEKLLIGTIGNILAAFVGIGIFYIIKSLSNISH